MATIERLWFSCDRMTVGVIAIDGLVNASRSAPIVARFGGQSVDNLRRWMERLGGFREASLDRLDCVPPDQEKISESLF